jgi:hypothetical protein
MADMHLLLGFKEYDPSQISNLKYSNTQTLKHLNTQTLAIHNPHSAIRNSFLPNFFFPHSAIRNSSFFPSSLLLFSTSQLLSFSASSLLPPQSAIPNPNFSSLLLFCLPHAKTQSRQAS